MKQFNIEYAWLLLGLLVFLPRTVVAQEEVSAAGGTWKKERKFLADLFAGFAFPQLIEAGTSRKAVDFGIWDVFVGVAFYTRPLF